MIVRLSQCQKGFETHAHTASVNEHRPSNVSQTGGGGRERKSLAFLLVILFLY